MSVDIVNSFTELPPSGTPREGVWVIDLPPFETEPLFLKCSVQTMQVQY